MIILWGKNGHWSTLESIRIDFCIARQMCVGRMHAKVKTKTHVNVAIDVSCTNTIYLCMCLTYRFCVIEFWNVAPQQNTTMILASPFTHAHGTNVYGFMMDFLPISLFFSSVLHSFLFVLFYLCQSSVLSNYLAELCKISNQL